MAELPRLNGIIRALESGGHALTCFSPAEISSAVPPGAAKGTRYPEGQMASLYI